MTHHDCKHYDEENGWCKLFTDWCDPAPNIEYCIEGPCPHKQQNGCTMIINTKHNIGDTVYVAQNYHELYACPQPHTVTDVLISGNTRHIGIRYETICNGNIETFHENWVFSTYEDCVKWCEKYN